MKKHENNDQGESKEIVLWELMKRIRKELKENVSNCFAINELITVFQKKANDRQIAVTLGALSSGNFWFHFHSYYIRLYQTTSSTTTTTDDLDFCVDLFLRLIQFKSILLLGVKLLGRSIFKEFLESISRHQLQKCIMLQNSVSSNDNFTQTISEHFRKLLMFPILIGAAFLAHEIESYSGSVLSCIGFRELLECIFSSVNSSLIVLCATQDASIFMLLTEVLVVAMCFATREPFVFFSTSQFLHTFLLLLAMVMDTHGVLLGGQHPTTLEDLKDMRTRERNEVHELKQMNVKTEEGEEEKHKNNNNKNNKNKNNKNKNNKNKNNKNKNNDNKNNRKQTNVKEHKNRKQKNMKGQSDMKELITEEENNNNENNNNENNNNENNNNENNNNNLQETNEFKEKEGKDRTFELKLSDLYAPFTQFLFSSQVSLTLILSVKRLSHFGHIVALFLQRFEFTIKNLLNDEFGKGILNQTLRVIFILVLRTEIIQFWREKQTSLVTASQVVTKLLPLVNFLQLGNNRNEMHALISSWIARSSTQSCAFQIEDLCMYQVISFNYLYGKLDLCFNPMCTGTTNRACQSERQNSMLRFLERDPLKIRNKYPITQQPIFMKCADCLLTQYCSKECQKQNWKCHRPYCKATCKSSHKKSLNPSLE